VDWVRPELLAQNPLEIANNQCTIFINSCQDFMASMHSDFFQVQTGRHLICWPNHSAETLLSKQEKEEEENPSNNKTEQTVLMC
jgi:hypothetical protein